jgi:hypothetical protein
MSDPADHVHRGRRDRIVTPFVVTRPRGACDDRSRVRGGGKGTVVRLLVVTGLTLTLLLGAVPLAVPGPLRLSGIPPVVSAALFGVAAVALLGGLVLLGRGRRVQRRAEAAEPVKPVDEVAPSPASVPLAPAPPARGYVTVRTRT